MSPWVELARPRGLPWVLLLPAFGYGFGLWSWAQPLTDPGRLLGVLGAWLALHVGTMWLNAALDKDEGVVLLGRSAPVPPGMATGGLVALLLAVGIGPMIGAVPWLCVSLAAGLSLLYSHPATVWKGHAVLGPLVNVVGYGVLSPIAGWSVANVPAGPRTLVGLVALVFVVAATYVVAQAFQADEDRHRGYRTFAAVYGGRKALIAGRVAYALSFGLVVGLVAVGWFPRLCFTALPAMVWLDSHLSRWSQQPVPSAEPVGAWIRCLAAIAGLLVGSAYAQYGWNVVFGGGVAGLGTAAGSPG